MEGRMRKPALFQEKVAGSLHPATWSLSLEKSGFPAGDSTSSQPQTFGLLGRASHTLFVADDKGGIGIRAAGRRLLYERRPGITGLQRAVHRCSADHQGCIADAADVQGKVL